MSERRRARGRIEFPTISHDEVIRDSELWDRYRHERMDLIKAGEPTWMIRGLDATRTSEDEGVVLDYYQGGGPRGFIEGNELDGFFIYGPEIEEGEGPHRVNTEPVTNLSEAQTILSDYIKDTSLPK